MESFFSRQSESLRYDGGFLQNLHPIKVFLQMRPMVAANWSLHPLGFNSRRTDCLTSPFGHLQRRLWALRSILGKVWWNQLPGVPRIGFSIPKWYSTGMCTIFSSCTCIHTHTYSIYLYNPAAAEAFGVSIFRHRQQKDVHFLSHSSQTIVDMEQLVWFKRFLNIVLHSVLSFFKRIQHRSLQWGTTFIGENAVPKSVEHLSTWNKNLIVIEPAPYRWCQPH